MTFFMTVAATLVVMAIVGCVVNALDERRSRRTDGAKESPAEWTGDLAG